MRLLSLCSLATEHEEIPYQVKLSSVGFASMAVSRISALHIPCYNGLRDNLANTLVEMEQGVVRLVVPQGGNIERTRNLRCEMHPLCCTAVGVEKVDSMTLHKLVLIAATCFNCLFIAMPREAHTHIHEGCAA